ncbi:PEGA domain-containing protein [Patescibacteria group bacterium]|nr:PEGA domain-containing protein [Patescibacteria group bacterium]
MSKKTLLPFILPLVIFITGLGFLGYTFYKSSSLKPSALSVSSKYKEAKVYYKGKLLGMTPIENTNIAAGKGELSVKGENYEFKREITISPNTLTSINYDTAVSKDFSAGYVVWYDKTGGSSASIFVSSLPLGAKVFINSKEFGETPLTLSEKDILNTKENSYTLTIEKDGYENQKMNLKLDKGYTLNIFSNLFLKPFPNTEKMKEVSKNEVYQVLLFSDENFSKNYKDWASAISYWTETRGAFSLNNNTLKYFDYFIDKTGKVYNGKGSLTDVSPLNLKTKPEKPLVIVYLTDTSLDVDSKHTEALNILFKDSSVSAEEYVVSKTPTGFLNIRETASTSAVILGKYNVGDAVNFVAKEGDWIKVKFNDKDGYVSAQYVTLKKE